MVHSGVPLGILPGGTANVLAMETKLGSRLDRATRLLEECRPRRISLGRVTFANGHGSRHFLAMAGVGLDAHIVYHVNLPFKARAGKLAYWVAGWSLLGRNLPQVVVESGGRSRRCSFALLSKVRNYGGDFEIAREVTLLDDRFEMVTLRRANLRPLRQVPHRPGAEATERHARHRHVPYRFRRPFVPRRRARFRSGGWRNRRLPSRGGQHRPGCPHPPGAPLLRQLDGPRGSAFSQCQVLCLSFSIDSDSIHHFLGGHFFGGV